MSKRPTRLLWHIEAVLHIHTGTGNAGPPDKCLLLEVGQMISFYLQYFQAALLYQYSHSRDHRSACKKTARHWTVTYVGDAILQIMVSHVSTLKDSKDTWGRTKLRGHNLLGFTLPLCQVWVWFSLNVLPHDGSEQSIKSRPNKAA